MRAWVVGFGTVGRWVVDALDRHADRLGLDVTIVGLANARDGFVFRDDGIDPAQALAADGSIGSLPDVRRWPTALEGLRATDADLLVEVSESSPVDGEPGAAHMREALGRGIPVVTSNKWPVAHHGLELVALARANGVAFRAESTVMSGTPLLRGLVDGLAGTTPIGLRGVLNATANFILTAMAQGATYEDALPRARAGRGAG